jgi:hypothetical protein
MPLGTGARRFHQRGAAVVVGQAYIGARRAQRAGDLFVAFGGGVSRACDGVHRPR